MCCFTFLWQDKTLVPPWLFSNSLFFHAGEVYVRGTLKTLFTYLSAIWSVIRPHQGLAGSNEGCAPTSSQASRRLMGLLKQACQTKLNVCFFFFSLIYLTSGVGRTRARGEIGLDKSTNDVTTQLLWRNFVCEGCLIRSIHQKKKSNKLSKSTS